MTTIDTSQATAQSGVDDLVHSPIKERKNSLQHALQHRPEAKELEQRHILQPGNPIVLQKKHELEKAMTADALKKHLSCRPTDDDLRQRNILPENPNLSPALAAHQKELEKHMVEDRLKEKLAHRPAQEELLEKGILSPVEDKAEA